MKFTLNDCLARINQVLNYPAVAYTDISHFFDQAIAELNTNLRIALPSISEVCEENTFDVLFQEGVVLYTTSPTNVPHCYSLPDIAVEDSYGIYVCDSSYADRKFYKWDGDDWKEVDTLYAVYRDVDGEFKTYVAVAIDKTTAVWTPVPRTHTADFDLLEYMPLDWWTLFVIPYVCFKFSVRNGDSGELFADEFTQGFQQLQSSYNVPNTVRLMDVAGKPAYTELVKQYLNTLANTTVCTRAIYEDMRVGNGIAPTYGGFYIDGGWL